PADDRVGLAGLHRRGRLLPCDGGGHRLPVRQTAGRDCGSVRRQRAAVLESRGGYSDWRKLVNNRPVVVVVAAAAMLMLAAACGRKQSAGALTIAVIPKGTTHVFWQSIHAGAEQAARELGATIIWRGPLREDDRDSQVSEVEGFVTRGVSGIVLAPLDESALVGPVSEAKRAAIPVVVIDSGLKGNDYVSFVATDNRKGGRLAGAHLAALLHDTGSVVLLRYAEG